MNKVVKRITIFSMLFFVSISYGMIIKDEAYDHRCDGLFWPDSKQQIQNPTCKFCKDHGGLSLAGKPLTEEVLKQDPLYGVVSGLETQEEKDSYLREMMRDAETFQNDSFNVHFRYHLAASVLAKANPHVGLLESKGEKQEGCALLSRAVFYDEDGGEELVQFLLDHNTDPNQIVDSSRPNALWNVMAASMAKLLLDHGARVVEFNKNGKSIFWMMDLISKKEEKEKIKALYRAALEKQKAAAISELKTLEEKDSPVDAHGYMLLQKMVEQKLPSEEIVVAIQQMGSQEIAEATSAAQDAINSNDTRTHIVGRKLLELLIRIALERQATEAAMVDARKQREYNDMLNKIAGRDAINVLKESRNKVVQEQE